MLLVRAFSGTVLVGQAALAFSVAFFSHIAFAQSANSRGLPDQPENKDPAKAEVPSWRSSLSETKEESTSRVLPLQSGFRTFEGSTLGFGAIRELPQFRTREKYRGAGLGFTMSFDQKIRGPWSGGIQGRWSQWVPHTESGPLEPVSPVSLVSRIEFSPSLSPLLGPAVGGILKPFAIGGVGYVTFLKYLGLPIKRAKQEASEPIASFGGGFRLVWSGQAALRFSAERWRGLRTFDLSVMSYQVEVQFGDVAR